MDRLYRFAVSQPRWTVVAALALVAGVAPGALRLKLRTDGHALVPTEAPQVRLDAEIREAAGLDDPIVVLIRTEHSDGIFNFSTLRIVQQLTDAFLAMDAVRPWTVFSLATEHNDRVWPGSLKFRRFLEPFPASREDLTQVRDDLRAIQLYTGILVSYDERATSVMAGVPPAADRGELYGRVRELVESLDTGDDDVQVIGAPVAEALLGTHILEDLGVPRFVTGQSTYTEGDAVGGVPRSLYELRLWVARRIGLLPLTIAVMAVVFFICFRGVVAVALPLMEVGAALAFVFGVMGWCGVPVYLTIAVLPVILVVTGVTDEIHVFTRYTELLRRQYFVERAASHAEAAQPGDGATHDNAPSEMSAPDDRAGRVRVLLRAMDELRRPVVISSLTTGVALMSFALSPLAAVRAFGIFTALGVIFCMFWSLMVIPAMLSLVHPRRLVDVDRPRSRGTLRERAFIRWGRVIIRHRFAAILLVLVVVAAAPSGVRRLRVQDSWIDGFAPESGFRRATDDFNERFLGTHILHVQLDVARDPPLRGELGARQMVARSLRFPGDLVPDPSLLAGRWIKMRRADEPDAVAAVAVPNSDDASSKSQRRYELKWEGWIESAERDGDEIVVHISNRRGSPRAALRLYAAGMAKYEVYSRPYMDPGLLHRVADFEAFVRERHDDAVGGALGPATYIATTNFMSRARRESERSIPDKADRIEWLWNQYERIRGIEHRRQIISDDYSRGIVTIYMTDANFIGTARLMQAIRDYENEHLAPHGISLSFAGDVAVSQTLIDAIVTTQVRSLLGSVIGILLITALLGRSLLWGLLSALPCALAVMVNFAVMGYVSMPLGVATSMFTGMTLGMGVDYAIHLLERYRLMRERGEGVAEAVSEAVSVTGPAVFVDAIAVALGFGVMTLSQVPANARLGGLVILSLFTCLVATFLLLPALLSLLRPRAGAMSVEQAKI